LNAAPDNPMDIVLIRARLEGFVRMRFGHPGTLRPQVPFNEWPWRTAHDRAICGDFVWNYYDDQRFPRAIGLRLISDPGGRDPIYEAAEWHGARDIRRTYWRYAPHRGWAMVVPNETYRR
jgi:hypothetical protein